MYETEEKKRRLIEKEMGTREWTESKRDRKEIKKYGRRGYKKMKEK